ncbi:HAD family phosphatase [uncultured Dubosiella sp.]|uniref:HAD family hydrolase n=1 Tax=uncultured Dubosiella sp. TaxID=1937011 RepID=UPI0027310756|nr:HAD family phosphatase [uncultured Dubosiella sp.]
MEKNWREDYDTFIFDMDGLLVNSEDIYRIGWKKAFEAYGLHVDDAIIASWNGKSAMSCEQVIVAQFHDPTLYGKLFQVREDFIYESLDKGDLHLLPYVKEVLEQLKKDGKKIALASSCRKKRATDILKKTGVFDLFDVMVNADDVEHVKPAPDIYEKALALTGTPKDKALVLEDSSIGVQAARNAGLDVVQVIEDRRVDPRIGEKIEKDMSFLLKNE